MEPLSPHLTRHDLAASLALIGRLEALVESQASAFEAACAEAVAGFIAASGFALLHSGDGMNDAATGGPGLRIMLAGPPNPTAIVLYREGGPFTQRDRDRAALLRPHLAFLLRQARAVRTHDQSRTQDGLTPRESEVMRWVACGKTDADIGALLAISPRTVHKHMEHIFAKLGVETRTAAAMRARPDAGWGIGR